MWFDLTNDLCHRVFIIKTTNIIVVAEIFAVVAFRPVTNSTVHDGRIGFISI